MIRRVVGGMSETKYLRKQEKYNFPDITGDYCRPVLTFPYDQILLGTDNFNRIGKNVYAKSVYWNFNVDYVPPGSGTSYAIKLRLLGVYPSSVFNS